MCLSHYVAPLGRDRANKSGKGGKRSGEARQEPESLGRRNCHRKWYKLTGPPAHH